MSVFWFTVSPAKLEHEQCTLFEGMEAHAAFARQHKSTLSYRKLDQSFSAARGETRRSHNTVFYCLLLALVAVVVGFIALALWRSILHRKRNASKVVFLTGWEQRAAVRVPACCMRVVKLLALCFRHTLYPAARDLFRFDTSFLLSDQEVSCYCCWGSRINTSSQSRRWVAREESYRITP